MKSKDIAKILGVSEATVSMARNNREGVSEETRRRVMALVNQLPEEQVVQSTANRRLCHVFVFRASQQEHAAGQPTPIFHSIMDRLSKRALALGYSVHFMFFYPEQQSLDEIIHHCETGHELGIFINDYMGMNPDYSSLQQSNLPIVIFDQDAQAQGIDCVTIDNQGAALMLTNELIGKGHKRILYVQNSEVCYNLSQRRRGFVDALWEHSIIPSDTAFVEMQNTAPDPRALTIKISEYNPTAIIVEETSLLMPVLDAISLSGLKFGDDIAVACCDAIYNTIRPDIDIPCINYNHEQLMDAAMMIMDARVQGLKGKAMRVMAKAELICY